MCVIFCGDVNDDDTWAFIKELKATIQVHFDGVQGVLYGISNNIYARVYLDSAVELYRQHYTEE